MSSRRRCGLTCRRAGCVADASARAAAPHAGHRCAKFGKLSAMDSRADSNARQSALAVAGLAALAWLSTLLAMQVGTGGVGEAAAASALRASSRASPAGTRAGSASPYALVAPPTTLRYDAEYPTVRYATTPRTDRVAQLQARLAAREMSLRY